MERIPRRPAQMKDQQLENIASLDDVPQDSEVAHTTAQILLPMGRFHREDDPELKRRLLNVIEREGIDVVAQMWQNSPEETLPGALWRGFLLREWIRRFPHEADERYAAARADYEASGAEYGASGGELDSSGAGKGLDDAKGIDAPEDQHRTLNIPDPDSVQAQWDAVLRGNFDGDFAQVLCDSARLTSFLAHSDPSWVRDEAHPLATPVTVRDHAMERTSREFRTAGEKFREGTLE
ncbi:MAG: hypothetical protein SPI12_06660 [Actinomycetaceae bacterium]|nr:hypothetical protein [Actinomycetaceae bacterium]MDY6083516.1 hypothetical protein [Actinomycetaceae bacterium]